MSAYGEFRVTESDDARYEAGKVYNIVLQGDHSYNEGPEREVVSDEKNETENGSSEGVLEQEAEEKAASQEANDEAYKETQGVDTDAKPSE